MVSGSSFQKTGLSLNPLQSGTWDEHTDAGSLFGKWSQRTGEGEGRRNVQCQSALSRSLLWHWGMTSSLACPRSILESSQNCRHEGQVTVTCSSPATEGYSYGGHWFPSTSDWTELGHRLSELQGKSLGRKPHRIPWGETLSARVWALMNLSTVTATVGSPRSWDRGLTSVW